MEKLGGGAILVVEDEFIIQNLTCEILESLGYEVMGVSNSDDALENFRREPGDFNLIITDNIMPGMTGLELIEQIRKIRQDIPVVLSTGYTDVVSEKLQSKLGIEEILSKPYDYNDLRKMLGRIFN
ncbi:response regulator [Deltaproteobacteria bacterium TL4]